MTFTTQKPILKGHPKFLVSRESWRGINTYHVCGCAPNKVIEIPKAEPANCPHCKRKNIEDIFAAIDRRLRHLPVFLEAMRVKDGPYGRYRDSREDKRPYSLLTAEEIMSLGHQVVWSGYDPIWTQDELNTWIDTILLDLNPDSGLIEDPNNIVESGQAIANNRALSFYFVNAFRRSGFPDKYTFEQMSTNVTDPFKDEKTALAFLEETSESETHLKKFTWRTSPYSMGSRVVRGLQTHRKCLHSAGLPHDGVAHTIFDWLDAHQNSDTGYWGGEDTVPLNAICGAYKILSAYWEYDRPVPCADKIIDTTLANAAEDGGFGKDVAGWPSFGCSQLDPLMLLKICLQQSPRYRAEDVYRVVARSYLNFVRYWSDDEHFFAHPAHTYSTIDSMHGMGTVMYMAEILLGVEILKPDR